MMMMIRYSSIRPMRLSYRYFSMKSMRGAHHLGTRTTTSSSLCSLVPFWSTVSFSSTASSSVEESSGDKAITPVVVMNMYNSLTQQIQSLPTAVAAAAGDKGGNIKGIACYTCGPTTYAPAHLGHARTYVQMDIFRRVLEYASRIQQQQHPQHHHQQHPQQVRHLPLFVMNITDVDDKILAAAAARAAAETRQTQQKSPLELARHFEAEFWKDWDALNCLRPHVVTRVTEHVESDIIPYIQQLVDLKMAYIVNISKDHATTATTTDGCAVYFDVRAFEDKMQHITRYGKLAPPSASTDFFNRVEPSSSENESSPSSSLEDAITTLTDEQRQKRDDRDFALWKPRKHGESMYWASPWGNGRPGWHIECSAMIQAVQQKFYNTHVFAIHAGGVDLKFPHHTNEIAQAEAYNSRSNNNCCSAGREWIPHWVHTGHLHIDGQKMSKSLKNFVTIEELMTDPAFTGGIDSPEWSTSSSSSSSISSSLSSPADDFRLWCLGLSGSYRGPATFSRERILEARAVRQKLVRFLLEGFEWLAKHNNYDTENGSKDSPKKWQESDYHLFQTTSMVSANAMKALLYSDLDGSAFLKHVVQLAEVGTAHLHSVQPRQGPAEAVYTAMDTLQTLLALVGFTDATTCISRATNGSGTTTTNKGVVVGGEHALLDEFVEFRNAVRQIALRATGKNNDDDDDDCNDAEKKLKKIMQLCDEARDCTFPALGVELMDAKVDEDSNPSSLSTSPSSSSSSWRYCLPRTRLKQHQETSDTSNSAKTRENATKTMTRQTDPIPVQDLFRLGKQYAGQFSLFDEHGFPTLLADGSEISNRLRKKLDKKRAAYAKRIATKAEEEDDF